MMIIPLDDFDDPTPDPHADRNYWQQGQLPPRMPDFDESYTDGNGTVWEKESLAEHAISTHQIDTDGDGVLDTTADCLRGEPSAERVNELRNDPAYQADFDSVQSVPGFFDANDTVPGYQACYAPDGSLTNSGTFDYATPMDTSQTLQHFDQDVRPHFDNQSYTDFPPASAPEPQSSGSGDTSGSGSD